jgi:ABC-type sugar transport system substrate-binding protein
MLLLLSWIVATSVCVVVGTPLKIGVVPKPNSVTNEFFGVIEEGCQSRAKELTSKGELDVECFYDGADAADPVEQAAVIQRMVEEDGVDGIAVSVSDVEEMTKVINYVAESTNGTVPVITFDSDAAGSMRQAFIATDNYAFGIELGKVLDQLNPTGGKYGMIAALAPNVVDRVNGVREDLKKSKWTEVSYSPADCNDNLTLSIEQMYQFAADPEIQAIVPVGGWPMFLEDEWVKFVETYPNLTIVCGDSLDIQLKLMNMGKVNGLVGQLPFQMGQMAVDTIIDLIDGKELKEVIAGTAVLEVLRFPLNLPTLTVNMNQIGNVAIMAFFYVPIIVVSSVGFAAWIMVNRKQRVVLASQPIFLLTILAGVVMMGLGIIPLSIDDGNSSNEVADAACMSVWWLVTIGFSLVFSALFSKTWRVNRLFRNPQMIRRIKVQVKDVLAPFVGIMAINVVTLICWTAISPQKYIREDLPGTDDWNRVIASAGVCRSDYKVFGIILLIVNVGVLLVANFQAYQARSIETEFSESKYISIIMVRHHLLSSLLILLYARGWCDCVQGSSFSSPYSSPCAFLFSRSIESSSFVVSISLLFFLPQSSLLQSAILGIPILALTGDRPRVSYVVTVNLIFLLCMVALGFIFVPKVLHLRRYLKKRAAGGNAHRVTISGVSMAGNVSATSRLDDGLKVVNAVALAQQRLAEDSVDRKAKVEFLSDYEIESKRRDTLRSLTPKHDTEYLSSKQQHLISLLQKDLDIDLDKFLIEEDSDEDADDGKTKADERLSALKKELLGKLQ